MKAFDLSKPSILSFKSKLRTQIICPRVYKAQKIHLQLEDNPFLNLTQHKVNLQLDCDHNYAPSSDGIRCWSADQELLVLSNFKLKKRFALMMRKVTQETINKFVFCDEKTLHNQIVGSIKVYRRRRVRRARGGIPSFWNSNFADSKKSIFRFMFNWSDHTIVTIPSNDLRYNKIFLTLKFTWKFKIWSSKSLNEVF